MHMCLQLGALSIVKSIKFKKIFLSIPFYNRMSPPAYSDLGKNARDVFGKGYHFGLWKLDVKTKTSSGVEFTTAGHSNHETGKVFGSLETKYKVKEYGLTFSEKWNTDNTLTSEVAVEDQLVKGLKLSFDGSFAPQSG
jgi:voltage-dependent anion channel protein 2